MADSIFVYRIGAHAFEYEMTCSGAVFLPPRSPYSSLLPPKTPKAETLALEVVATHFQVAGHMTFDAGTS